MYGVLKINRTCTNCIVLQRPTVFYNLKSINTHFSLYFGPFINYKKKSLWKKNRHCKKKIVLEVYQKSILLTEFVMCFRLIIFFRSHISIRFQTSVVDRDALSRLPSSSSCVTTDDRIRIGANARGRRQIASVAHPAIDGERRDASRATSGAESVPSPPGCGPTVHPVRRPDSPNRPQESTPSERAVRTAVTAIVRVVGVR